MTVEITPPESLRLGERRFDRDHPIAASRATQGQNENRRNTRPHRPSSTHCQSADRALIKLNADIDGRAFPRLPTAPPKQKGGRIAPAAPSDGVW